MSTKSSFEKIRFPSNEECPNKHKLPCVVITVQFEGSKFLIAVDFQAEVLKIMKSSSPCAATISLM
jgi:hypothetical protein